MPFISNVFFVMFKKVVITAGARLLNAILGVAMVVIAARWMGAPEYGVAGVVLLDVTVVAMANDFFGGSSLVFFTSRMGVWRLMLPAYIWAVVVVVAALLAGLFLSWFPEIYAAVVPLGYGWQILGLSLLVSWAGIHQNLLLGNEQVAAYNRVFSLQVTVQFGALMLLLFVANLRDARAWVGAMAAGYGVSWLAGMWATRQLVRFESLAGWHGRLKEILAFGMQGQLASLVHLGNKRFSFYLIGPLLGPAALGVYNAGAQLTEGLRIIGQSIALVQFSHLSNSTDHEHNRLITLVLLKFTVLLTFAAMLVLVLIPPQFFAALLGSDFGLVRPVIIALGAGVVALAAAMIFSHYFSGTGKPVYNFRASVAGIAITVLTIYPAVKYLGITGAGLTASAAYIASAVYQGVVFCRLSGSRPVEFLVGNSDLRLLRQVVAKRLARK